MNKTPTSTRNQTMTSPLVSIVITTKNEERHIENCLRSIKEQTYANTEIIVVDNQSTDKTKELAKKYTTHVYDKGPERSAQRNYGLMDIAAGEFGMFVDADMILSPCLVEECVAHMQASSAVALHISEFILGVSYWSRVRNFERSFYDGTPIDGARFFRTDVFSQVGGFDEGFSGPEDWDLDKKLKNVGSIDMLPKDPKGDYATLESHMASFLKERGAQLVNQNVVFHNESEFDLKRYLGKKKYYSQGFDAYIEKWDRNDPDLKKQFGLAYRFLLVFFEKGKWKRLLAHPFLLFGMYFLRFLVGVLFVIRNIK